MGKGRLEAFSDGVLAIIITIMVLELKVPAGADIISLRSVFPIFISYVLSFIYIGIYWNNHHHLMHVVERVNGKVMWANLHLLFWLSLVPFATSWMGENNFKTWPVAIYGFVLFMAGVAYSVLEYSLTHIGKGNSILAEALGKGQKGKISLVIYFVGIAVSFINSWISFAIYAVVAGIWFLPDRRIEKKLEKEG